VRIGAKRRVLDPSKPAATRDLGDQSWPLYAADFGLGMALTGARTWYRIVPELRAGLGFVSDFRGKTDVGGFKYGTRFALTWGAGVRYVPGGDNRLQLRGDLTNRLFSISYPDSYFRAPSGGTAILTGKDKSVWRNNPSLTIGISYLFSR
jgi:hypothetical protein